MSLRFCGCTLDIDARRLFRGTEEVHLSPKAFETFRVLIENRHRAMSKAELLDRVWADVNVTEVSLARVISEIRERLGDDRKDGRIIRTVHSHGYAFVAEIDDEGAETQPQPRGQAVSWLVSSNWTWPLYEGSQVIGRDPALEVTLDSPNVSRRHARIDIIGADATIEDLGSKNGTYVADLEITGPTPLNDGDEIVIGRFRLVFRVADSTGSTETEG
jgi:DNA-binding winged helix-turn-helix (wHTH) protein